MSEHEIKISKAQIANNNAVGWKTIAEEEAQATAILDEFAEQTANSENESNGEVVSFENTTPKMSQFAKKKKIKTIVGKIVSVLIWAVGLALLYLCLSNLYQQVFNPSGYTGFFGIGEAVVASDSMKPMLSENDLIFYKEASVDNVSVGDTIVYKKTNSVGQTMLIVHNVESIGDGYVVTKGINNALPDEAFSTGDIIGKYMFKIGKIGAILSILSNKTAPFIVALIIIVLFAVRILLYYLQRKKIISNISTRDDNRIAIDHFFDI